MNKKLIWGIVIAVIVIAGAWFVVRHIQYASDKSRFGDWMEADVKPNPNDRLVYKNPSTGLSFLYPANWIQYEGKYAIFGTADYKSPQLHVNTTTTTFTTLDAYLKNADSVSKTAWEAGPSMEVKATRTITIAGLDAIQRDEAFLAAGFVTTVTYFKKGNMVYSIYLAPRSDATGLSNQDKEVYNAIISSISFTN